MTIDRRHLAAAFALAAVAACAVSGLPGQASAHPSKSAFTATVTAVHEHRVPRLKRLRRHREPRL